MHAAYSGDTIAMAGTIRMPFKFEGSLWVTVGTSGRPHGESVRAYRVIPLRMFQGEPTTYRAKVDIDGGETARNDPMGFYHGMRVKSGKEQYVIIGPETHFVAEPPRPDAQPAEQQMELFA